MRKEVWRPIWGFYGLYEVSSEGRIRGMNRLVRHPYGFRKAPGKIIRHGVNEFGYHFVILYRNNKSKCLRVSRLVAKAFLKNPRRLPEVNHKKGNKMDNRAISLEWASVSDNRQHAYDIGLNKGRKKVFK